MSSFQPFAKVVQAPADKILGLREEYVNDSRLDKIDLSIGVYRGDDGRTRFLDVVQETKNKLANQPICEREDPSSRVEYLPITGLAAYCSSAQKIIFGASAPAVTEGRIITIQTVGGTGAIRVGADFLHRHFPSSQVYISDPTWVNHRSIFQRSGFEVATYPYFDAKTKTVIFDRMQEALRNAPKQSIIVLQATCHNPTGFDPKPDQWVSLIDVFREREHIAFFDFAYQGFESGVEEDSAAIRAFTNGGVPLFVSGSFSKNFSLYNSRVGTLSVVTSSADEAKRVVSQIKTDIRATYSSPPRDAADVVATVLGNPQLRERWENEVGQMRNRIALMRESLLKQLRALGMGDRFAHLHDQRGLFFYSGLSAEQMGRLKNEFGIYGVDDGRICIAAITPDTVEKIAQSMAKVAV